MKIASPFPRFGGKSAVASVVWQAFGNVPNYVEPFFGTGAVLLGREEFDGTQTETVNDADCYLANFWRSVQADADAVAKWADQPVSEVDLHARHLWLVSRAEFRERMMTDPDYYDPKVAGWWVWGQCAWIGSGWCDSRWFRGGAAEPSDPPRECGEGDPIPSRQLPHLGNAGRGIHRKLPHLGDAGRGIHRKLPHLGDAGRGYVFDLLGSLRERIRRVRVACGDWTRVTGDSVTWRHGVTGVFLDPPYAEGEGNLYSEHDRSVSAQVREWAIANGDNPKMRIALCGYEGEHEMPDTWSIHAWKARGGYGSQSRGGGNDNAKRERIWFSPHCLGGKYAGPLFAMMGSS